MFAWPTPVSIDYAMPLVEILWGKDESGATAGSRDAEHTVYHDDL